MRVAPLRGEGRAQSSSARDCVYLTTIETLTCPLFLSRFPRVASAICTSAILSRGAHLMFFFFCFITRIPRRVFSRSREIRAERCAARRCDGGARNGESRDQIHPASELFISLSHLFGKLPVDTFEKEKE